MTTKENSIVNSELLEEFTLEYLKEHEELINFVKKETEKQLRIGGVVKPLKAMEEATIIDYCNEIIELFELPNHSNNAWKKAILENAIVNIQEVLKNF